MDLKTEDARFVIRSDATDPSFARWSIEFDGQEYVTGTRPAPRDDVHAFIDWLKMHVTELQVDTVEDDRSPPGSAEGRW